MKSLPCCCCCFSVPVDSFHPLADHVKALFHLYVLSWKVPKSWGSLVCGTDLQRGTQVWKCLPQTAECSALCVLYAPIALERCTAPVILASLHSLSFPSRNHTQRRGPWAQLTWSLCFATCTSQDHSWSISCPHHGSSTALGPKPSRARCPCSS